jgi:hypothetical protein
MTWRAHAYSVETLRHFERQSKWVFTFAKASRFVFDASNQIGICRFGSCTVHEFTFCYDAGMTRDDVKPAQAATVRKAVVPMLSYLSRLQQRMEQIGFPLTDPFYQSVKKARESVFDLSVDLHYLSCSGGVGRITRNS